MAIAESHDLQDYCEQLARRAKSASERMTQITGQQKNDWLHQSASRLREQTDTILSSNRKDLEAAPGFGLTEAQADRLKLTAERVDGIARGMEDVAKLPDPIGEVIDSTVRPNGIRVSRLRVPLGVVFFVYESRPNVTADAAAICVKSGNSVILRGGKEAAHSSEAIVSILNACGQDLGLPPGAVQLVGVRDREAVGHFLALSQYIDLAIPRGGAGLIRRVAEEATMPVIKHYHGNCHVYIDQAADPGIAESITINSKCQRMGVCNAAESLVIHEAVAATLLPRLAESLAQHEVEIRGDEATCTLLPTAKPATEEDYVTEYLGPIISVKVVKSLDEAIEHINRYG